MRKYGYIPDDGDNSAALFTEDGLDTVIKEIQKYGALKQTGKLDNDTLAVSFLRLLTKTKLKSMS